MTVDVVKPQIGDVLLDTDITLQALDFYERWGKIEFSHFLDLSQIISLFAVSEALVLNQRLLSEHVWPQDEDRSAVVRLLAQGGVLKRVDYVPRTGAAGVSDFHRRAWAAIEPFAATIAHWPGADFTLNASMERAAWCDANNIDHLPWPLFGAIPAASLLKQASVVHQISDALSTTLRNKVRTLQGAGAPIPVFIPPIATVLLERCAGRPDKFLSEALAMRDEFAAARSRLWEYQRVISTSAGRSLGEQFQAYRDSTADVSRELARVSGKRTDSRLVMELWDAVVELKAEHESGTVTAPVGLNIGGLLSRGLRWFQVQQVRGRARFLFDLHKKALDTPSYGHLIERVFHTDPISLHTTRRPRTASV